MVASSTGTCSIPMSFQCAVGLFRPALDMPSIVSRPPCEGRFCTTVRPVTCQSKDSFLGVRNTFFDLSDSPSLQQWYKDTRGIRSCPASEHGDDDQTVCGDDVDEDDAMQTPETSPRNFHEEENPQPSPAACIAPEPAKARTPLKSGASPYRPTPAAAPTCSTTYYAVPSVASTGQALAAEYHRRVQASRQLAQAQARQSITTYAPPDHLKAGSVVTSHKSPAALREGKAACRYDTSSGWLTS